MAEDFLTPATRAAGARLAADLQRVFGERLLALIAYEPIAPTATRGGASIHTLALAATVTFDDLARLLTVVHAWHSGGLATPLILGREEFERTLDVFPVEYGSILARHVVLYGEWPFTGLRANQADLRRACERQIKGHLIHLRAGYLETHGRPAAIADLIRASVPAFRSALQNIAMLQGAASLDDPAALGDPELDASVLAAVLAFPEQSRTSDPAALMPRYLEAVERLWRLVDGWSTR